MSPTRPAGSPRDGPVDLLLTHGCPIGLADQTPAGPAAASAAFLLANQAIARKSTSAATCIGRRSEPCKDGRRVLNVGPTPAGSVVVIDDRGGPARARPGSDRRAGRDDHDDRNDRRSSRPRGPIAEADAIVVAAGAGMGVDSGLPDFRGPEGFWRAYPAYKALGLRFEAMASPDHFAADPALGWGFYGHRRTCIAPPLRTPGSRSSAAGSEAKPLGGFVFTSNVDDHFGRAGFDRERIVEVHGSIEWRQCLAGAVRRSFRLSPTRSRSTRRRSGGRPLPRLPAVWRPGPAQHPDVRRLGLDRGPDRGAARPVRRLARTVRGRGSWWSSWGRGGDPHGPPAVGAPGARPGCHA